MTQKEKEEGKNVFKCSVILQSSSTFYDNGMRPLEGEDCSPLGAMETEQFTPFLRVWGVFFWGEIVFVWCFDGREPKK